MNKLLLAFSLSVGIGLADDTAAIQALINGCATNGTVTFAPGTYSIGSTLAIKPHCTYTAATPGTVTFQGYSGMGAGGYPLASINSAISTITFTNLVFSGGGLVFDAVSGNADHITIDHCTFQNINNTSSLDNGALHSAVYFTGSGIFSIINVTNNYFYNLTYGQNVTYGTPDYEITQCRDVGCNFDWDNGSGISIIKSADYNFSDNVFDTIGADAIKGVQNNVVYAKTGPYNILRNQFFRIRRMPIETQDGYTASCVPNKLVQGNVLHEFITPYYDSFGISIMDWCTTNTEVSNNIINSVPAQTQSCCVNHEYGIPLEMGVNRVISNIVRNDPNNANNMLSVAESDQHITNNTFCGPNFNTLPPGNPFYDINTTDPAFINPTLSGNVRTASCSFGSSLSITTSSLPGATLGSAYSQTVSGTGGLTPYFWRVQSGALPNGLSLNSSTGAITGTPTSTGTSNFTMFLADSGPKETTHAYTIVTSTGGSPPSITTNSPLPGATQGTPYTTTLAATGGTSPYTWSVSAGPLPTGLSLDTSTGILSGTPTGSGTTTFTIMVTDSLSANGTKPFTLVITGVPTLSINNTSTLPVVAVVFNYNYTLSAIGGTPPYTWTLVSGTLPTGLTLSSAGIISGTPTVAGAFSFTVRVTDSLSVTTTKALSITLATFRIGGLK